MKITVNQGSFQPNLESAITLGFFLWLMVGSLIGQTSGSWKTTEKTHNWPCPCCKHSSSIHLLVPLQTAEPTNAEFSWGFRLLHQRYDWKNRVLCTLRTVPCQEVQALPGGFACCDTLCQHTLNLLNQGQTVQMKSYASQLHQCIIWKIYLHHSTAKEFTAIRSARKSLQEASKFRCLELMIWAPLRSSTWHTWRSPMIKDCVVPCLTWHPDLMLF